MFNSLKLAEERVCRVYMAGWRGCGTGSEADPQLWRGRQQCRRRRSRQSGDKAKTTVIVCRVPYLARLKKKFSRIFQGYEEIVVATYTGKVKHSIKLKYLSSHFAKILTKQFILLFIYFCYRCLV